MVGCRRMYCLWRGRRSGELRVAVDFDGLWVEIMYPRGRRRTVETARLPGPESRLGMGSTQHRGCEVATLFRSYYHRHLDGQPPAINWTWRPTSPSKLARVLREGIPSSVCHRSWSGGSVVSLVRCDLTCRKILQLDSRLSVPASSCWRLVVFLEADPVRRRVVNCTTSSDSQGCGEIV